MPNDTIQTLRYALTRLLLKPFNVKPLSLDETYDRFEQARTALLIFPFRSMGNVILAMPSIQVMRALMPNTEIDLIVHRAYVQLIPDESLHEIIPFDKKSKGRFGRFVRRLRETRRRNYDVVVDCSFGSNSAASYAVFSAARTRVGVVRPAFRSSFHVSPPMHADDLPIRERWSYFAKAIGREGLSEPARIVLTGEETAWADEWYAKHNFSGGDKRVVFIAPGGRASNNRFWPLERFLEVSRALTKSGIQVVFMLGPEEESVRETLAESCPDDSIVAERNGMRKDAALMALSDLYIGCDCGATHLAKAVGAQILVIQRHEHSIVWSPGPTEGMVFFDSGKIPTRPVDELAEMARYMLDNPVRQPGA